MRSYKVPINKDALRQFYVQHSFPQSEIDKVIFAVMKVHFNKYISDIDYVKNLAYEALLARRDQFRIDGDAYNYTYTIIRNCLGNHFRRESKITELCEPIVATSDVAADEVDSDIDFGPDVNDMLTGESDKEVLRVPRQQVLPIVILMCHARPSHELQNLLSWKTPFEICSVLVKFFKESL